MTGVVRAGRAASSLLVATARQVPRRRIVATAIVVVILVAVALWVPLPTAVQLRDWAR